MKRQMREVYRESQRDNALPSLHGCVLVAFISEDMCRITNSPLLVTRRTYPLVQVAILFFYWMILSKEHGETDL